MTTWTVCPDCGVGPIGDHKKDCLRAGWNQTYRPRAVTAQVPVKSKQRVRRAVVAKGKKAKKRRS